MNSLHEELVLEIQQMLDEHNQLVKSFRMVREKLHEIDEVVKLRLIGKGGKDGRRYNLPVVSEVAALIVGDIDENICDRDIIVELRTGHLKRIHELHPTYLPLQTHCCMYMVKMVIGMIFVFQNLLWVWVILAEK